MSFEGRDKQRLSHIVEAIDIVQSYIAGMGFAEFLADPKTIDAVVRNLIIVGEAAYKISPEFKASNPDIPLSEASRMRHILVHEYHRVDASLVWEACLHELPELRAQLASALCARP